MSPARRLNVFFSPPPPERVRGRAIAVIDTARATTTLTTLIAGGAEAVYPVPGEAEARALAAALPGARLCGERGGHRIAGFDFGNSPSEFAAMDVRGMRFVQTTSNGTRAVALAAHAAGAFVVCLRNRAAAARALRDTAAGRRARHRHHLRGRAERPAPPRSRTPSRRGRWSRCWPMAMRPAHRSSSRARGWRCASSTPTAATRAARWPTPPTPIT